jgi:hypothetical protein
MVKSDIYRQKAADSERQAAQAHDAAVKRHHLKLAEAWKMMADRILARESKSESSSTTKGRRSR